MSSDRELLEIAAKAAGLELAYWVSNPSLECFVLADDGPEWNPLTDDGDSRRLEVKLRMNVRHDDPDAVCVGWDANQAVRFTIDGWGPWYWKEWLRDHAGDRAVATRRAVLRAAAELGRTMATTATPRDEGGQR